LNICIIVESENDTGARSGTNYRRGSRLKYNLIQTITSLNGNNYSGDVAVLRNCLDFEPNEKVIKSHWHDESRKRDGSKLIEIEIE